MGRPQKFNRDLMLEKAMHLFWEKGFEQTTIEDLTRKLKIHPGSLYGIFKDKEKLFMEVFDRYMATVAIPSLSVLLIPGSPINRIQALFASRAREVAATKTTKGCLIINTITGKACPRPITKKAVFYFDTVEDIFITLLKKASAEKSIKRLTTGETNRIAGMLAACLHGMTVLSTLATGANQLRNLTKGIKLTLQNL